MANPFGDPVASNIQSPASSLADMLGVLQKKQDLQTGQYRQQTAQADAQQAQQKNSELQQAQALIREAASPKSRYDDGEGGFDHQKMADDIARIGPYAQEMAGSLLTQANTVAQNRSQLQSLAADQNKQLSGIMQGLAGLKHPTSADLLDAITQARTNNKDPKFNRALDSILMNFRPDWDSATIKERAANAASYIGGFSQESPATVDTGANIQPGTTNKFSGGFSPSGAPIAKQVAPGANLVTDMAGAQYILDPQKNTIRPVGAGNAPNPGGFKQPSYVGQKGDIEANQGEIRGIRSAGDAAPQAHNINDQILRLSKDTNTGPGTAFWRQIPMVGGLFGDDYQELGKYLEKNAINNMSAMGGPPSDARLSAASAANGSTHFNPGALQAVTKFNDATTTGVEKFRRGADAAVGLDNPDYTKLAKFKSDWSKNFDVDVYRYENAMKRGDDEEIKQIESERGKKGMAELLRKRQALETLAKTGRLGQ